MQYLLDTNTLIYYFNGIIDDHRIDTILDKSFNISIISKIEFLSWTKLLHDRPLDAKAHAFLEYADIYDLNDAIAMKTIELRRNYKTKTPDAIIAATALIYDMSIVTHNVSDFQRLGLEILQLNLKT